MWTAEVRPYGRPLGEWRRSATLPGSRVLFVWALNLSAALMIKSNTVSRSRLAPCSPRPEKHVGLRLLANSCHSEQPTLVPAARPFGHSTGVMVIFHWNVQRTQSRSEEIRNSSRHARFDGFEDSSRVGSPARVRNRAPN